MQIKRESRMDITAAQKPQQENEKNAKDSKPSPEKEIEKQVIGLSLQEIDVGEPHVPHVQTGNPRVLSRYKQKVAARKALREKMKTKNEFVCLKALYCPCGHKTNGPLGFFEHVRAQHQGQDLERVTKKRLYANFLKKYPENEPSGYEFFQSLEDNDLQFQISQLALEYSIQDYQNKMIKFPEAAHKGTYADLAYVFLKQYGQTDLQKLLIVNFFNDIKQFIVRRYNEEHWLTQSPKEFIRMANHIYYFFKAGSKLAKKQFGPIQDEHFKQLVYILGRWMFINKWTNDRLARAQEEKKIQKQVKLKLEELQMPKEVLKKNDKVKGKAQEKPTK